MAKGTQVRIEVEEEVTRLEMLNHTKAQIYRYLGENKDRNDRPYLDAEGLPSKSTIDRIVDRLRARDESGPWAFTDASPDEGPLVLDVLLHMYRASNGRVWLTKEIARLVAQMRRASPTIPPAWAYVMATMYQRIVTRTGIDHIRFDLVLAIEPWQRSGPAGSWGLFAPDGRGGRTMEQIQAFNAFVDLLAHLAEELGGLPEPQPTPGLSEYLGSLDEDDATLDPSRNQALT